MSQFYTIKPLPLVGAEIFGVDLKLNVNDDVIAQIKLDVTKYRLLIFRDQGIISGDRHVEISKWFGELDSTFYNHPRSPHLDVFRVSNNEEEGCRGVGRTGWHIDGSFQPAPFGYSLYHIVSVPTSGDTAFSPLNEVVQSLTPDQYTRWNKLYMMSDRRGSLTHPLIYPHPLTGKETLCFHLGMTSSFVYDWDTPEARFTEWPETKKLLQEIHNQVVRDNRKYIYQHKWTQGDFIISDNLAVGHEASPETQLPEEQVGLRIMHRTTVKGQYTPQK
ncbi:alpha-ketoglutarate-dependent taurine dioxygenase-like [Dysidea avara]|uniref:alpha-ketoglutarate-dependent taurine dioxygenase-like n=1 Tax=Dysidea avara TaxID=196820 RepID=UPI00332F802D